MNLSWVPRWLFWLLVIALIVFVGNVLGFIHIHFNVGGSVSF